MRSSRRRRHCLVPDAVALEASFLEPISTCPSACASRSCARATRCFVVGAAHQADPRVSASSGAQRLRPEPMAAAANAQASGATDVRPARDHATERWRARRRRSRGAALVAGRDRRSTPRSPAYVGGRVVLSRRRSPISHSRRGPDLLPREGRRRRVQRGRGPQRRGRRPCSRSCASTISCRTASIGDAPGRVRSREEAHGGSMKVLVTMNGTSK